MKNKAVFLWARAELATLWLTAEVVENLSALSGVAYVKVGAILTAPIAPNSAPKPDTVCASILADDASDTGDAHGCQEPARKNLSPAEIA